jgi:uncharacterized membrane protein YfcA
MIDLLFEEISTIDVSEGLLRAVLVHLWFVWIHPFPDGNGRVARFLPAILQQVGSVVMYTIPGVLLGDQIGPRLQSRLDPDVMKVAIAVMFVAGGGAMFPTIAG